MLKFVEGLKIKINVIIPVVSVVNASVWPVTIPPDLIVYSKTELKSNGSHFFKIR
jgi:hypothetical protein